MITPFSKIPENIFGSSQMWLKDESENPYGTIKDRRNNFVAQEALRHFVNKLVLITSGNNGYSLAKICKKSSIKIYSVVDTRIEENIYKTLNEVCEKVIKIDLQEKIYHPEDLLGLVREYPTDVIWDVTNGYEQGYWAMFQEIFGSVDPDYIVVPLGSGGIYTACINFIEHRGSKCKVIGIGAQSQTDSMADKLTTSWTPYHRLIENKQALGHAVFRLTEAEIRQVYKNFNHLCNMEPSSATVFAAPQLYDFKSSDVVVFVNTGTVNEFKV